MYFLDVGQGDAAFVVTPNNTKILVDGGLRDRALGFLIWKYRLDLPNTAVTIDHLFLSHADMGFVDERGAGRRQKVCALPGVRRRRRPDV